MSRRAIAVTAVIVLLLAAAIFAGLTARPRPKAAGEASPSPTAPLAYFTPINRNGELDVPEPWTGEPNPPWACQILRSGEDRTVLNLTASITWTPTREAAQRMKARLDLPGTDADVAAVGSSPLKLVAKTFNMTVGESFRFLFTMDGSSLAKSVQMPEQIAGIAIHYVLRTNEPPTGETASRWDSARTCQP